MKSFTIGVLAGCAVFVAIGINAVQNANAGDNRAPIAQIEDSISDVHVGGKTRICASIKDRDGDRLKIRWYTSKSTSTIRRLAVASANEYCAKYTAPLKRGWDTVTVRVTDGHGGRAWARITFCVLMDDFNAPQPSPGNNCYN